MSHTYVTCVCSVSRIRIQAADLRRLRVPVTLRLIKKTIFSPPSRTSARPLKLHDVMNAFCLGESWSLLFNDTFDGQVCLENVND